MSGDPTAVLRPQDGGGLVELPYLVAVTGAAGVAAEVPVERRTATPGGGLLLTGGAAGFGARAEFSAPVGPTGRREVRLTVTRTGQQPVEAGLRVEVLLGRTADPGWLVPGAFYGENRVPECTRPFPRFEAGADDPEAMVSDAWAMRADRCATPAVFARDAQGGAALETGETSGLGLSGVGFALTREESRPALRLHFPYREEPVTYYGTAVPRPAQAPLHRWQPGESRTVSFAVHLLDADPHAYAAVLRDAYLRAPDRGPAAWVGAEEAAELAAWGLYRWHYRPDPPVLLETAAFDREALGERGDRGAMHVGWVSGTPCAYALLRHARRTGNADYLLAATGVLDHIAGNLTPAGTFWGQWTASRGWAVGWTPDPDRLHARTLAEATLFLLRALAEERDRGQKHPAWEHAVRSNLAVAVAAQDPDGNLGSAYHKETGAPLSRAGAAGLAWVPALVEAARLFEEPALLGAARRAGRHYSRDVHAEFLCGAPEDVDLAPTSEDGYVAVMAYTALLRADDGAAEWLDLARRSAEWMLTFRYSYDVAFSPRTLLGAYRFRTRGGDQASPSNQHLHAYGLVCLPEAVALAHRTGDRYLLAATRDNLDCFRQFVAREDGDFGAYRGMVSERFYQTECFQAKGMLLTLSHAWTCGLLLYACEAALDLPELAAR